MPVKTSKKRRKTRPSPAAAPPDPPRGDWRRGLTRLQLPERDGPDLLTRLGLRVIE